MVPEPLRQVVRTRAGERCEYCQMSQALQGATFHIEHVIPVSKGGITAAENLALACPSCNLEKSDLIESEDPLTGRPVPLYHPRRQAWRDHFTVEGARIVGVSPTGRATVALLQMNSERRLQIRQVEQSLGWWPPDN
jgi:hypothetical protein